MNAATSVVIPAYTEERWDATVEAVESILTQEPSPLEVILVIDHNPDLLARAQRYFAGKDVVVVENKNARGLNGARNSGIEAARGSIVGFMDDDAIAEPDWLHRLVQWCADPNVIGAGGRVDPLWLSESPKWFPEEFYWVVGCSYRGMPEKPAPVRNPFGGCMVVKRKGFEAFGGFLAGLDRVGEVTISNGETELCIRARQHWPETVFIFDPEAVIRHRIPPSRTTWRYYITRCYNEGLGKAIVSQLVGSGDALASERTYTLRSLPIGVLRGLRDGFLKLHPSGFARAGAIIIGLVVTTLGYLVGSLKPARSLAQDQTTVVLIEPIDL